MLLNQNLKIIDFNGNNAIYDQVNCLHLLIFNDKNELIDDFFLFEKRFSNLTKLSKYPGQCVLNKYDVIIFVDEMIKISFLFIIETTNIEYSFFDVGLFNNRVFTCLQKNVLFNDLDFIVNFTIDWSMFDGYCSHHSFTKLLSNFVNYCQSHLLLKRLM